MVKVHTSFRGNGMPGKRRPRPFGEISVNRMTTPYLSFLFAQPGQAMGSERPQVLYSSRETSAVCVESGLHELACTSLLGI
eukprot:scaffold134007_cov13-Tisochrysis_lutea.AAC.1